MILIYLFFYIGDRGCASAMNLLREQKPEYVLDFQCKDDLLIIEYASRDKKKAAELAKSIDKVQSYDIVEVRDTTIREDFSPHNARKDIAMLKESIERMSLIDEVAGLKGGEALILQAYALIEKIEKLVNEATIRKEVERKGEGK